MNIAIDATILRSQNSGTGFYIINLITGLLNVDDKNKYFIFGDKEIISKLVLINKKNFTVENAKFKSRIIRVFWQLFIFPFKLKKLKIDVLHSTNYITPLFKFNFKIIVTIHDLTFFLFPEMFTITKRLLFKFLVPFFVKRSNEIIVPSESTKEDILRLFKISKEKIAVTYESYPAYYNSDIDKLNSREVLEKYGITKNYFLFVGMIEPRKNILSILKAFVELDEELDEDLVIVGRKGWNYKDIEQFMNSLNNRKFKNKIIFTGFVSELELVSLYQNATIFIYPSFYEGFGIPPLEAMICGVPVITSNTSSLPEVVEDAAIKINPYNYLELKEAIKFLKNNPQKREELIQKGKEQAKKFGLNNFAKKTINVYEKI